MKNNHFKITHLNQLKKQLLLDYWLKYTKVVEGREKQNIYWTPKE